MKIVPSICYTPWKRLVQRTHYVHTQHSQFLMTPSTLSLPGNHACALRVRARAGCSACIHVRTYCTVQWRSGMFSQPTITARPSFFTINTATALYCRASSHFPTCRVNTWPAQARRLPIRQQCQCSTDLAEEVSFHVMQVLQRLCTR